MSYQRTKKELREILMILMIWGFIITFIGQPSYVPSESMREKLRAGDVVLVSKMHYGPRVPRTLSIPFTEKTIWGTRIASYINLYFLPYLRLPGFSSIQRGDVMVFNAPHEDEYPTEVKTRYVKEVKGMPGDSVEIIDGVLYINDKGESEEETSDCMYRYFVKMKQRVYNPFFAKYGILKKDVGYTKGGYYVYATRQTIQRLQENPAVQQIIDAPILEKRHLCDMQKKGVPYKGMKIEMTGAACETYGETICKYEGHGQAVIRDKALFINGKKVTFYTFKQNYYFVRGKNIWRSFDSREWNFVPEDHIEGKAFYILLGAREGLKGGDHFYNKIWLISLLRGDFEWARCFRWMDESE